MATILVVDDERPIRTLLAVLFRDDGHRVEQAIHGQQALELIGTERPDMVIADIMMPVMNGVELCRLLKLRDDTKAIPVILMTAGDRRASNGAGADAFIAKPFRIEEMEELVRRLLPQSP